MGRRKPYSEEFKSEVIRRLNEDGISITALTREVAVDVTTIRYWKQRADAKQTSTTPTKVPLTLEETQQALDRSNELVRRQQMEIDILKKAMGILSRMPQ